MNMNILYKIIRSSKRIMEDFLIFMLTVIGYIPIHLFRIVMYKIVGVKIGKHTSFHWRTRFYKPWNIQVGNNSIIGNDAMFDARNGIYIGNNVSLSMGVWIWTMEHDPQDPYYGVKGGPVVIEDYVWLSCRVVVLPGITIGKGAVVAAGAVVTKNVAPYTIVSGIPARVIGHRIKDLRYVLKFHKAFQ